MESEEQTSGSQGQEQSDDLQQQFEEWRRDSIPIPGQEMVEQSVEERLQNAMRVKAIRRVTLLILSALAFMGLSNSFADFAYFFTSSDPIDLGDVREAYLQDDPLEEMEHNQYVKMDAMIPTSVYDSAKHRYFFCPLYNVIVRTPQNIREKQTHKSYFEIAPGEDRILKEKLAFVWDLPIRMDMEGRLLLADSLPGRYQHIWKSFRHELDFRTDKPVYILIDEEVPGDFWWYLLAYLGSLAIIAFSASGYLQAARVEKSLRAKLTA